MDERTLEYLAGVTLGVVFGVCLCLLAGKAHAHDIYEGVHGRNAQLCCGGNDCAPTFWRERAGHYEFLTRERDWVEIPEDRITFLPSPGEPADAPPNFAHLCYSPSRAGDTAANVFGDIFLYCAFIKPGGA